MSKPWACLWLLAFLCIGISAETDLTRVDDQRGRAVVDAVVDKIRDGCIYPRDRLFLQRIARVESKYGEDVKTYRPGYHGGIWQIDEEMFKETFKCHQSVFDNIRQELDIDWTTTQWSDLRKPLYSGLAAALYLTVKYGTTIPGEITDQADIWSQVYRPGQSATQFRAIILPEEPSLAPIDLAFVIDGSDSISDENFKRVKKFMEDLTSRLKIDEDSTRVAALQFSHTAQVEFDFTFEQSLSKIQPALENIAQRKEDTNTAAGLRLTYERVFQNARGSRHDAAKVVLLITDGRSNVKPEDTPLEAKKARDHGLVIFAIGVGNVVMEELEAIASDPDCSHVFMLSEFSELDMLLDQFQRCAGRAPIKFTPPVTSVNTTNQTQEITRTLTDDKPVSTTVQITPPDLTEQAAGDVSNGSDVDAANVTGVSMLTTVKCGVVHIYASYETTHPGPALHEYNDTATELSPSVLYINYSSEGKPLYVTYQGSKLPSEEDMIKDCQHAHYSTVIRAGEPTEEWQQMKNPNSDQDQFQCYVNWVTFIAHVIILLATYVIQKKLLYDI